MTESLIARAQAALVGVTDGEWEHDNNDGYSINRVASLKGTVGEIHGDSAEAEANARFIAASRQLVPELIAQAIVDKSRIETLEMALAGVELALEISQKALKPFAAFGSLSGADLLADDYVLTQGSRLAARQITIGDMRRARAALKGSTEYETKIAQMKADFPNGI